MGTQELLLNTMKTVTAKGITIAKILLKKLGNLSASSETEYTDCLQMLGFCCALQNQAIKVFL